MVLNITDKQSAYCADVAKSLQNNGFRCEVDLRNEKIGFKIREHTIQRVPYLLVAGDKEVEAGTISVRDRTGKDRGVMPIDAVIELLSKDAATLGRVQAG